MAPAPRISPGCAPIPTNSSFNITKTGTNQVALVYVTEIDPMLADIDIQGGAFCLQTTTTQFGNPTNTITVHGGAFFNVWDLTQAYVNKKIVMQDGSTYWSDSGTTTNVGLLTATAASPTSRTTAAPRYGSKPTPSSERPTSTNSAAAHSPWPAATAGPATPSSATAPSRCSKPRSTTAPKLHSPAAMQRRSLTSTGRTDGTLTLLSGQTLKGNGIIRGSLTANAGSTIAPGLSVGTIAVTNTLTLGGTTTMEIDALSATNDRIAGVSGVANTIHYGGTLTVTSINGILLPGQSFRLFEATNILGAFAVTNLPPLPSPLYWTNDLGSAGTITVVAPPLPPPNITNTVML